MDELPRRRRAGASTADAVARRSYGKLVASSDTDADVAAAEDALSEDSLRRWRIGGERVSANPEGWLLTVARRR